MSLPTVSIKYSLYWCADWRQSLIPVVMSGIIAVYGLVIAVLIAGDMSPPIGTTPPTSLYTYVWPYEYFSGTRNNNRIYRSFMHLASGLSVGLAGVAAGYTIGIVGDAVSSCVYYAYLMHVTNECLRVFARICNNPGFMLE